MSKALFELVIIFDSDLCLEIGKIRLGELVEIGYIEKIPSFCPFALEECMYFFGQDYIRRTNVY